MDPSGYLIRADSLPKLLEAVTLYRRNNGFAPGNPAVEVENVYRVDYPWLVSKVGLVEQKGSDPVARWLERAWRVPQDKFVETQVVEARTKTCLECPHYDPARAFDADALRRITILGRGKYSLSGACKVHHWPVGLALWLESPDHAKTVDGCWAT